MINKTSGAIYYSDNQLDEKIFKACQKQLRQSFPGEIISCCLQPTDFGDKRIVLDLPRGYEAMFRQILTALEASTADIIFFCEQDVLYPPEHFDFTPPSRGVFYYNQNWWKIGKGDLAVHWDADQVSGLCCYRDIAIDWYRKRVKSFDAGTFDRKFEPMSGEGSKSWKSTIPLVDIRHNHNLTYSKWSLDDFRNKATAVNFEQSTIDRIPGWSDLGAIIRE